MNSFYKLILAGQKRKKTYLCVGLDPYLDLIPKSMTAFDFLKGVIDATEEFVCCFKPQIACFAAYGLEDTLLKIIEYIHKTYPETPVILDAKRNDIGSTSEMYARELFNRYGADAVTVNPYMGQDSLKAFIEQKEKGVFVLCRTSNPGAGEFQNLKVEGKPLYSFVAHKVLRIWNQYNNIGLVVGATALEELKSLRNQFPKAWFLVPGVGVQGGDISSVIQYGKSEKGGLIINSSRSVLYAGRGAACFKEAGKAAENIRNEMKYG